MKAVKLFNENEVLYFSNPTKAAKHLGCCRANVSQSLLYGCKCKGYNVEIVNEDDLMLVKK